MDGYSLFQVSLYCLRKIYDLIAKHRTSVSKFFGQPACGLNNDKDMHASNNSINHSPFKIKVSFMSKVFSSILVITLIFSTLNYNLVANESVNRYMSDYGYEKI